MKRFEHIQPTADTDKRKGEVKALVDNPNAAEEATKQINQP